MRLNPDCIRDILLCIEEVTTPMRFASFIDVDAANKISEFIGETPEVQDYNKILLEKYPCPEIMYHLNYCQKDSLIEFSDMSSPLNIIVADLTPSGHKFLADIRHKTVFEKTKTIAKKLGVESLPAFRDIAGSVTSEIVKSYLNLS